MQCQSLDERGGRTVTTLDSAVHVTKKVAAGMLAGKLQAAAKGRLPSGGDFLGGVGQAIATRDVEWHRYRPPNKFDSVEYTNSTV